MCKRSGHSSISFVTQFWQLSSLQPSRLWQLRWVLWLFKIISLILSKANQAVGCKTENLSENNNWSSTSRTWLSIAVWEGFEPVPIHQNVAFYRSQRGIWTFANTAERGSLPQLQRGLNLCRYSRMWLSITVGEGFEPVPIQQNLALYHSRRGGRTCADTAELGSLSQSERGQNLCWYSRTWLSYHSPRGVLSQSKRGLNLCQYSNRIPSAGSIKTLSLSWASCQKVKFC